MTYPPMPVKPAKIRKPVMEWLPNLLLGVLAVTAITVSGWSMATLLHNSAGAPWWVSGLGVGVFDVLALLAALLVKQRAEEPWRASGAQLVMLVAVAASAAVNGAHGANLGGWTTALVLGAAPVTFEIAFAIKYRTLTVLIWLLFGKESLIRLKQEAWQRIAIPVDGGSFTAVQGSPKDIAETVHELTAGSQAREARLTQLTELIRDEPELTSAQVADELGVSLATAKRDLKEVRSR